MVDLSVGKANNKLICDALSIPLSSIDNNLSLMGYRTAEILDKMLDGEQVSTVTLIPPRKVVSRVSTQLIAVGKENLRRALNFIQLNYTEDIGIEEVVAVTGVSLRGLQQLFSKQFGHGIGESIFKDRIERARELLLQSEWTIEAVANTSGFFSMRNFFNRFKKEVDVTPGQYRKSHLFL